ncbi:trypsin-like serine protease [Streptomyces sp. C11-1]|uniref:Trypsin-like serine protease n=1 Tax=Streptomyces durocortorensis TaxID=2811104 RepID=A0ABY9VS44_9ACTN|nr:trypsin-like serine protease [Streptomyces durocortorensis]WNF26734.1 trypsin-like serine protease [Streptomyces durocortorensis]
MSHLRPRAAVTSGLLAAALVSGTLLAPAAHAIVGTPSANNAYAFTARLDIGDGKRACSGTLVDRDWVLTAASCFVDNPAGALQLPPGAPKDATTAVIGRTDSTTTAGQVRTVVELVPRADRDLVLARLAKPVTTIAPAPLAATPPAPGETLTGTGFGRTADEWAPVKMHQGRFSVDQADATTVNITGLDGAAVCAGDTGGPMLREQGGNVELVAVNSRSWQGGCFGTTEEETRTGAVESRVDDLHAWVTETVTAAPFVDFNGDGHRDVAVADPKAAVAGAAGAGLVRVVYGNGAGVGELVQGSPGVNGGPEAGDGFGTALATVDYNADGYTDLVVGVPNEDIGKVADAGAVQIVYGSPAGLGKGRGGTWFEQGRGAGALLGSASEAKDHMGFSVAAGKTAAGDPYILIGVPGEDLGSVADAGNAIYLRGDTNVAINQNTASVPGGAEKGDQFGYSVAGSPNHLAIGIPNEAIGTIAKTGAIQILKHDLNANKIPTPVKALHQDTEGISGVNEANDLFGKALSMTSHRPEGAATDSDSILAVGSPGEGLKVSDVNKTNAGRVVVLRITAGGTVSELQDIHQEKADVTGAAEAGDRFGERVAAVNTRPRNVGTTATMLLAVGIPGENEGAVVDSGAIQKFSLLGAPGAADRWISPGGAPGLPGAPGTKQYVGSSITATPTHLYIGMPDGPGARGAAHLMPWSNVTGGPVQPVTSYEPGKGGLPAVGEAFGSAIQ